MQKKKTIIQLSEYKDIPQLRKIEKNITTITLNSFKKKEEEEKKQSRMI